MISTIGDYNGGNEHGDEICSTDGMKSGLHTHAKRMSPLFYQMWHKGGIVGKCMTFVEYTRY